jgi:hypothetical protein
MAVGRYRPARLAWRIMSTSFQSPMPGGSSPGLKRGGCGGRSGNRSSGFLNVVPGRTVLPSGSASRRCDWWIIAGTCLRYSVKVCLSVSDSRDLDGRRRRESLYSIVSGGGLSDMLFLGVGCGDVAAERPARVGRASARPTVSPTSFPGRNTAGSTPKYRANVSMWRRVNPRSPLSRAVTVELAIPVSRETVCCVSRPVGRSGSGASRRRKRRGSVRVRLRISLLIRTARRGTFVLRAEGSAGRKGRRPGPWLPSDPVRSQWVEVGISPSVPSTPWGWASLRPGRFDLLVSSSRRSSNWSFGLPARVAAAGQTAKVVLSFKRVRSG